MMTPEFLTHPHPSPPGTLHLLAGVGFQDMATYDQRFQQLCHEEVLPAGTEVGVLELQRSRRAFQALQPVVRGAFCGWQVCCPDLPKGFALALLDLRDQTGCLPHLYFAASTSLTWVAALQALLFHQGELALLTQHHLKQLEKDPRSRPRVHEVG